jgi:hypothetical protein
VVQGPVGCREDLGFEPEGGGSHGGLWAGEGGPGSWAPPGGRCKQRWTGVGDEYICLWGQLGDKGPGPL